MSYLYYNRVLKSTQYIKQDFDKKISLFQGFEGIFLFIKCQTPVQSMPLIDKEGKPILRKTWMIYNDVSKELPIVRLFVDFVRDYAF